jgi:hypothetical protein
MALRDVGPVSVAPIVVAERAKVELGVIVTDVVTDDGDADGLAEEEDAGRVTEDDDED